MKFWNLQHKTWTLVQNIASLQMQAPLPLIQGFGHAQNKFRPLCNQP